MKTYRVRIDGDTLFTGEDAGTHAADGWRAAGQHVAKMRGISPNRVFVEVSTKIGFVRTNI